MQNLNKSTIFELAEIYGYTTNRFNEQVKNIERSKTLWYKPDNIGIILVYKCLR